MKKIFMLLGIMFCFILCADEEMGIFKDSKILAFVKPDAPKQSVECRYCGKLGNFQDYCCRSCNNKRLKRRSRKGLLDSSVSVMFLFMYGIGMVVMYLIKENNSSSKKNSNKSSQKPKEENASYWFIEGMNYYSGKNGHKVDYDAAIDCFQKAKDLGDKDAESWIDRIKFEKSEKTDIFGMK